MKLPRLTVERLTDLKGLMDNFPEEAVLNMNRWTPGCGTACCAAGNAVIHLKSWSDHLEFYRYSIIPRKAVGKERDFATSYHLKQFLEGIRGGDFGTIFVYPHTIKEVSSAISMVLGEFDEN